MVKAIIFDCFGVLTADTWKEFVATLPESEHQPARELNQAYGAAMISKDEFLREIEELTGKQLIDIDNAVDNDRGVSKNVQLLEYIKALKKDYKIGLLSNVGSNWIRESFLTAEERASFDDFALSYELHLVKPDPRIFSLAADRLGVSLDECVFVDDIDYYCAAARDLGMKTVCYQNFEQTKAEIEKLLWQT